jgi:hypothetical protein
MTALVPLQIFRTTDGPSQRATVLGCPVQALAPDRVRAALAGVEQGLAIVISGDGLTVSPSVQTALSLRGAVPLPLLAQRIAAACEAALGPRALLVGVVAAADDGAVVVGLPDHDAVIEAAVSVLQALVDGDDTARPAEGSRQEAPAPSPDTAPPSLDSATIGIGAAPPPGAAGRGWQGALAALGLELHPTRRGQVPAAVERLAPVNNLLTQAGESRPTTTGGWTAFGFPDLQRPGSKVLLVRDSGDSIEVVAAHRSPQPVGVCGTADGWLPARQASLVAAADGRVARGPDAADALFAVESDALYLERGGRIHRWDGRREVEQGSRNQALASLLLRWSQR